MGTVRRILRLVPVLAVICAVLCLGFATGSVARAADGLDTAAAALRGGPVYVDPRARDVLRPAEADALARKIEKADKPVFVAVLPADGGFDRATALQDLRTKVGITGVYAVALGDRFDAGADRAVMSRNAVENLTGAVQRSAPGDPAAMVTGFVEQALPQAGGAAPDGWRGADSTNGGSGGLGVLVALGVLVLVAGGGALVFSRRAKRRREESDRLRLDELRPVVDEDITAFGEELSRIAFEPNGPAADDAMRAEYTRALDAYDTAKGTMDRARTPEDVRGVSRALEEGRFALAALDARIEGRPPPERRPPCFFDPRHGPSVQDVPWTPQGGGAERVVPVCAADAARLADGEAPMARQVGTPHGPRPYWEAGPAYAPWASGYYGGGLLPGLLAGTLLGSALSTPYAYGDTVGDGAAPDQQGGDYSGADFDPGDFGGGGGGGDFGGGGFDG
ncbi:hypothetical protein ACFWVC_21860 [Streptomyces sp. NPDC058691]|uniref:hypothetical protein n=1 Tax=Streptomyces sp. NPDC058691 TaxID=3346601 RepID=UPI00365D1A6C